MQKITLLTLLVFIFSINCYSQQPSKSKDKNTTSTLDCKKFKTGTFYSIIPGNGYSVRTKHTQKSYSLIPGKESVEVWKLKWISDCKFQLAFVKSTDKNTKFKKGVIIM